MTEDGSACYYIFTWLETHLQVYTKFPFAEVRPVSSGSQSGSKLQRRVLRKILIRLRIDTILWLPIISMLK
jgi:hypothetical protein